MASSDSQIDKPRGCPKRAEMPINGTGAQSINTEDFFKSEEWLSKLAFFKGVGSLILPTCHKENV